jgi:hypothetical protein
LFPLVFFKETLQENLLGKLGLRVAFDRDEMMTQTMHDRGRRNPGGDIGIVTVRNGHPHRREHDGRGPRVHLHATVNARLSGANQV